MPMPSNAVPLSAGRPSGATRVHHGRKQPTSAATPPIAASSLERLTGRRCIVMVESPGSRLAVDLGPEHAHELQVPIQLAVVEPIADDELVRDREPGVVDVDV